MRDAACSRWIDLFRRRPFAFLTGDLGYDALEPLREVMGDRFINAGLAEQSMVSVAAGLATRGIEAWVYTIGPFGYARACEQIRNDVCHHGLSVRLVCNGGGFGYGTMGPSHHSLEDYGILLTLPDLRVFVPAFDEDVVAAVDRIAERSGPAFLRLGRGEAPDGWTAPPFAPWRRLASGAGPVVVVVGPIVGGLLARINELVPDDRPEIWSLSELPVEDLPAGLLRSIEARDVLLVVEEHVAHGGAGPMIANWLLANGRAPRRYVHLHAHVRPGEAGGSQAHHRRECGLDVDSLLDRIRSARLGR